MLGKNLITNVLGCLFHCCYLTRKLFLQYSSLWTQMGRVEKTLYNQFFHSKVFRTILKWLTSLITITRNSEVWIRRLYISVLRLRCLCHPKRMHGSGFSYSLLLSEGVCEKIVIHCQTSDRAVTPSDTRTWLTERKNSPI